MSFEHDRTWPRYGILSYNGAGAVYGIVGFNPDGSIAGVYIGPDQELRELGECVVDMDSLVYCAGDEGRDVRWSSNLSAIVDGITYRIVRWSAVADQVDVDTPILEG